MAIKKINGEDLFVSGNISGTTFYGDGSNLTGVSGGGTFTGGTVTGPTIFTGGVTANTISATTISATTFYGDGSQLTGISGSSATALSGLTDVQITGTTHNNEVLTYNTTINEWTPSFIPPIGINEIFRGRTFRYDNTTVDTYAGIATLNNASAIAQTNSSTNFASKFTRLRYYASIVSTGRVTSIRSTDLQWFVEGGFRFISTFRIADTAFGATCQNFHGLIGTTSEIAVGGAGLIQVSTLTNCIFVGSDGADANLQVMHNDASGTCTKIDLGANFPSNRTSGATSNTFYSVELYNQVRSTAVKYRVINLETGAVAQGTITTNLPANSQGLAIQSARVMGSPITNTGQWEQHKWGCYDITY